MLISYTPNTPIYEGDGSKYWDDKQKKKTVKRREMVMSIMIYDEMTDKVGWNKEKTTTTTTSNGDGKLPKAEEIELSFNKSFYSEQ